LDFGNVLVINNEKLKQFTENVENHFSNISKHAEEKVPQIREKLTEILDAKTVDELKTKF
jgi:flagellar basal body-associated protein FliL